MSGHFITDQWGNRLWMEDVTPTTASDHSTPAGGGQSEGCAGSEVERLRAEKTSLRDALEDLLSARPTWPTSG